MNKNLFHKMDRSSHDEWLKQAASNVTDGPIAVLAVILLLLVIGQGVLR